MPDLFTPERPQVITAMVTPFIDEDRVDYDAAAEIATYLVNNGSDGLVLAGTTGESPFLEPADHLKLFDEVRYAVGHDVQLIGGTGGMKTKKAVELSEKAAERGSVNQLLVVSPAYNRPSQFGIVDYYRRIGQATDLDVILYNIPVRTGRIVKLDTIKQLVDEGVVQGVKDATDKEDFGIATSLHAEYGDSIDIYSGADERNVQFLRHAGAVGAISVASHWAGELMQEQFQAFADGDMKRAERIDGALEASYRFESVDGVHDTPNPVPAKIMMGQLLGPRATGEFVSPMLVSPEEQAYLEAQAAVVLRDIKDFQASSR